MTLLLSSLMSVGALASDIHPVDPVEAQCEDSQALHAGDTRLGPDVRDSTHGAPLGEHDEPGHDHHAHACGSCHIHLVGHGFGAVTFTLTESVKPAFGPNTTAPRDGPAELFRPPRT